ncbi:MAG: GGDEF domain-containing protein [Nitrospirae bacterium]|nr:GGDEF domain-containing protein [Nitrospirota bacterium]
MAVNLELIDIQSLSTVLEAVTNMSDISFAVYDNSGLLIMPAKQEDRLSSQIKSSSLGRKEFDKFIQAGVERALIRKEFSVIKGFTNQNQLFIPVSVNGSRLVFVSTPFYYMQQDFDEFVITKGQLMGLHADQASLWGKMLKFKDPAEIEKLALSLKPLFETLLWCSYEKNLNSRRYQWARTLIDVLYSVQLPAHKEEVYNLIVDAILFLFNVNTVSIFTKDQSVYSAHMTSGRMRDDVSSTRLDENNNLVSRCFEGFSPVSTNDMVELSRMRLPESVNSIHLFPLSFNNIQYGLMAIYNSVISREETYSILEFCKLASLVLNNLSLQNAYDKCIDDMSLLRTAVTRLIPHIHNIDTLHDTIVDTATDLMKAEKGSLLMPDEGALFIKAVKGINKWLTKDIKVRFGEGVAGKVFQDGKPLLSKNINALDLPCVTPKNHYKTDSFVSVPLQFASETMGVLNIADKISGEAFNERDLHLLKYFASYASISLKVFSYYSLAEEMKELSITDHLTGLFNRRYLQERFTEEIHRSERYDLNFSIAMFDIDDFKLFNDSEGHIAGDSVLRDISRLTRDCLRTNDVMARFGGEEFAIIMPQTTKEEAFMVAERIRIKIREAFLYKWKKFPKNTLTISMGISCFPQDGKTAEDLIKSADEALYEAKSFGKNKTVLFSSNR